jgi:hypothetical protein
MASAVATEYFGSRLYVNSYDHDPGATTAVLASPDGGTTIRYLDMKDYEHFAVQARPTIVGGSGLTKVEIVASATTAFSSVVNVKDSGTVAADSLNDTVFLECSAEEIAQLAADAGVAYRYVAARLTQATNTDEANVTYIAEPKRAYSGLTATAIT